MFKREMKVNFKSFLIWLLILVGIFTVVFLVYPSIINSDNVKMMDEMMEMFPEEMLKAFNMDISSIDSAFGWLKTEGFIFILLLTGCYSGILGSNILLKEESDKTIEYLNSLPIKRNAIVLNKALSGLLYIVLIVVALGVFNFIGLSFSGEFDKKMYILLSITPIFSSFVIYFICMFLSTFTHKTKKMLGVCLGIVFISYVLQTLSSLAENVEFLKYFSVFTLADIRNVITDITINPLMVLISIVLSILFLGLTIIRYNKKELV